MPVACLALARHFDTIVQLALALLGCRVRSLTCPEEAADFAAGGSDSILSLINGKPLSLLCHPDTGLCDVDIQDFPISVSAPCNASECLVPGTNTLTACKPLCSPSESDLGES